MAPPAKTTYSTESPYAERRYDRPTNICLRRRHNELRRAKRIPVAADRPPHHSPSHPHPSSTLIVSP